MKRRFISRIEKMLTDISGITLIEMIIALSIVGIMTVPSITKTIDSSSLEHTAVQLAADIESYNSLAVYSGAKYRMTLEKDRYAIYSYDRHLKENLVKEAVCPNHIKIESAPFSVYFTNKAEILIDKSNMTIVVKDFRYKKTKLLTIIPESNRVYIRDGANERN